MLKTRKWLLAVSVALVGMIVSLLISFFPSIIEAKAETIYYSAEKYTEDDGLLQDDGTHSYIRDIRDFATDVKSGYNGQSFHELAQVIPLEYLESTDANAEFSYNGKEYGFYMAKEGNYFDILLIDFIYEFEGESHTNNEYKIGIEPILQQRFIRTGTVGNYQWKKAADQYKYYVSNPRFLTVARNENDLNYGDTGYSKLTDDGVIIQQTRLNYSKILYKTEEDLLETCLEFGADKILSSATDLAVDFLDTYTFGLASLTKDLFDFTETLYEEGQEEDVEANNEANIFTQQSKTEQRNGSLDGYSRVATFIPTDEIVLAAADEDSEDINDNSYAEFITVLNDTNYRTRLNQYCEFDIVRRAGNYASMEPVNDKNTECYSFSKERFLFEDQQPQFAFDAEKSDGSSVPVYMLEEGNQTIEFTPEYSGTCCFTYPLSTRLSLNGEYDDSFELEEDQQYSFLLENTGDSTVIGSIQCALPHSELPLSQTVAGGRSKIMKFIPDESGFQRIEISSDSCTAKLLDNNYQEKASAENGNLFYNFLGEQKYYLVIENRTSTSLSVQVNIGPVNEIQLGSQYTISPEDRVLCFANDTIYEEFQLSFENAGGRGAQIVDGSGHSIGNHSTEGSTTFYSFALSEGKECYTIFSHADNSIEVSLHIDPEECQWVVNGQAIAGREIRLKPGTSNELEFYIDDILYDGSNLFHIYGNCEEYSFSEGILQIAEGAEEGDYIAIVPDIAAGSGLSIYIDDFTTDIILKYCDGINDFEVIEAVYNEMLPNEIAAPYRTGYTFLGYYSEENGNGTRYYDGHMNGVRWTQDTEEVTLYAHWQANTYKIIYKNLVSGMSVYTTTYTYGVGLSTMPEIYMRAGYSMSEIDFFYGWYTDKNFTTRVYSISKTRTGDITLYAKYDLWSGTLYASKPLTVTDGPIEDQECFCVNIMTDTIYYDLIRNTTLNTIKIEISMNIWEVNDGYQHLYLYNENDIVWETTIEHGPGYKETTPQKYTFEILLDVDDFATVDWLDLKFGASGMFEDTWQFSDFEMSVFYINPPKN